MASIGVSQWWCLPSRIRVSTASDVLCSGDGNAVGAVCGWMQKQFVLRISWWRQSGCLEVVNAFKYQGQSGPCWTFSATSAVDRSWRRLRVDTRGSLASCTPSSGTYCSMVVYGWTEGAFVRLSTDAGLASSFHAPYVQYLTEGCSSWLGAELVRVVFWVPCAQAQGRGGHVHRDMAPIIKCTRALGWTDTLVQHRVRTTTTREAFDSRVPFFSVCLSGRTSAGGHLDGCLRLDLRCEAEEGATAAAV